MEATTLKTDLSPNDIRTDFNIVTYYKPNAFEPVLSSLGKYHYIYHDSDENVPHYHIALKTVRPIRFQSLIDKISLNAQNLADINGETFRAQRLTARPCRDERIDTTIEYFLHVDSDSRSKGKHEYTIEELHSNYTLKKNPSKGKTPDNDAFFDDLMKDYENTADYMRSMARKYGRDFIKNYTSYDSFRMRLKIAERETLLEDTLPDEYECPEFDDNILSGVFASQLNLDTYIEMLQRRIQTAQRVYNASHEGGYVYNPKRKGGH